MAYVYEGYPLKTTAVIARVKRTCKHFPDPEKDYPYPRRKSFERPTKPNLSHILGPKGSIVVHGRLAEAGAVKRDTRAEAFQRLPHTAAWQIGTL